MSKPESYIRNLEELVDLTERMIVGPYPDCTSIDGHVYRGNCDCNEHEKIRRAAAVIAKIGEIRGMQKLLNEGINGEMDR